MKKYMLRLSVATLTFSIGTAAVYLFAWDRIDPLSSFKETHSCGRNSPYSVLEGRTVRLEPYDATFDIPESWLTPQSMPTPVKNLHLSRQELSYLYWNDDGDAEDAEVINSVLSFQDCAAHVGDRDWGNYLWNDLQSRVYIVDLTPEEIAARIQTRGVNKAFSVFEGASLMLGNHGAWHKLSLRIVDAPDHFMLVKSLDFYYRPFGSKTVVFVFIHAGGFDETINGILNSFKWSNEIACG